MKALLIATAALLLAGCGAAGVPTGNPIPATPAPTPVVTARPLPLVTPTPIPVATHTSGGATSFSVDLGTCAGSTCTYQIGAQ